MTRTDDDSESRHPSQQIRFSASAIEMAHGAGGVASRRLIEGLFLPILSNQLLAPLEDAAILDLDGTRLAVTADGFVVKPLRFPGGSIGELAVNGTLNDLAVSGAKPVCILTTFVIEAGLPTDELEAEVRAVAEAARRAGVNVAGGDTQVVEHGKADGMYITTAGIGLVDPRVSLGTTKIRDGDRILLSGPIGDHGITVLLARGELDIQGDCRSDTRAIYPLVEALIEVAASGLRWMRDPTRGGVATALSELAHESALGIHLEEEKIPLRDTVRGACELLGLDPLHIANEGQFLAVVAPELSEAALEAVRGVPGGENAAIVGEIRAGPEYTVVARTSFGGTRRVEMLVGDPLPRIC